MPVGTQPGPIAVADFDLDGHEDLAVGSGSPNSGAVDVRLGRGDATFTDGENVAVAGAPTSVVAGDLNADGRTDLVVPNVSGTISVRLGSGDPRRANLLANGDFEQGVGARLPTQSPSIPGWLSASGMTFARYGLVPHLHSPTQLGAPRFGNGGLNFLWGGGRAALAPGGPVAGQGVDVTASSEAIDAGRATANLSWHIWAADGSRRIT